MKTMNKAKKNREPSTRNVDGSQCFCSEIYVILNHTSSGIIWATMLGMDPLGYKLRRKNIGSNLRRVESSLFFRQDVA